MIVITEISLIFAAVLLDFFFSGVVIVPFFSLATTGRMLVMRQGTGTMTAAIIAGVMLDLFLGRDAPVHGLLLPFCGVITGIVIALLMKGPGDEVASKMFFAGLTCSVFAAVVYEIACAASGSGLSMFAAMRQIAVSCISGMITMPLALVADDALLWYLGLDTLGIFVSHHEPRGKWQHR